jgi:uncharacterized protein
VVRICPRCKSPYWDTPRIRVPPGGGGLGITDLLAPHRTAILRMAARYGAREVRVFGSVARGSAGPASDIDFLVDFVPSSKARSTLRALDMAMELERLLGRRVDVVTESSLPWFIQPQIISEAVPL